MKFGRFFDPEGAEQVGVVTDKRVTVLEGPDILSAAGFSAMVLDRAGTAEEGATYDPEAVQLLAPLRPSSSIRDFMAFEGHVANAMKGRGAEVPPRWYELPTFYFTNPHVVHDPDTDVVMSRSQQLDYELEFGVVVGRDLADAQPEECLDAVAGFTILNDFSARDLQFDEMAFESGTGQGQGLRPRHWARWS